MSLAVPSQEMASTATSAKRQQTEQRPAADNDKVCWIEMKLSPYQANHQVVLLHLQAEADALLLRLQTSGKKQIPESAE